MKKSLSSLATVSGLLTVLGVGVTLGLVVSAPPGLLGTLHAGRNDSGGALAASERGPADDSPFTAIASSVAPAVVFIEVKREASEDDMRSLHPGMPFDEMFRQMFPDQEGGGDRQPMVVPSAGSGFFIDSKGLILTNNHVVRDADHLRVKVSDQDGDHYYDAELVGQDRATDVAVIRVKGGGSFATLALGNSDDVRVGDWAIAVGNPFGTLNGTLTVGVVSAKGRSDLDIMGGRPDYQDFIQTDASINFGNSGGPLLNSRGEVIGINTAINPSGQGIGFAIPINIAKEVAETLIKDGRVTRGYIGILPQELTPELAESMGLRAHQGVLVGNVIADGPAAKAGIESGDVIVSLGGDKVSDVTRFRLLVAKQPVDRSVDVKYLRDGKESGARLTIAERKEESEAAKPHPQKESWLGIEVEEISGREAERMGLGRGGSYVIVSQVVPGSPADDAGIQEGDVIRKIGGREIEDAADYRKASEGLKDREAAIPFLIERNRLTQFYAVKPRK